MLVSSKETFAPRHADMYQTAAQRQQSVSFPRQLRLDCDPLCPLNRIPIILTLQPIITGTDATPCPVSNIDLSVNQQRVTEP